MFCRQAHILMIKQQREPLAPEQDAALHSHLATCRECAEEQRSLQDLTGRLSAAPLTSPLPALSAERRDAIWSASRLANAAPSRLAFGKSSWVLAAATVLIVALGLRVAFAPTAPSHKGGSPDLAKNEETGAPQARYAAGNPPTPHLPKQERRENRSAVRDTPRIVNSYTPLKHAPVITPKQTLQQSHRTAVEDDSHYLDGTESTLAGYWLSGKPTSLSALVEKQKTPFRDDFVSIPSARVASLQGTESAKAAQESIKQAAQVVDARLFRKVTLAEKDASLEEICAKLKKLTGVHLAAAQGVLDEKATVFVKDKPAREVMRALARLFGYTWERSGEEGVYFYYFKQPLRAQLAEEELRSRDEHEAFLALDAEMQKIAESEGALREQHPYWWAAKMYNRLSPSDRTALVNGEKIVFTLNASNPDRRIPADLRASLLKAFDFHLMDRSGTRYVGKPLGQPELVPDTQDLGLLAEVSGAMPAVQLDIDRTELGALKLHAQAGAYLPSEKGWISQPSFPIRRIEPMAIGRSASRKKPNNALANKTLRAEPAFLQTGDLLPLSSCKAQASSHSGNEMVFHMNDNGEVEQGEAGVHVSAGDVWAALHKQTGMSIVADSYLRFHSASEVSSTNATVFDALCRAADAMHVRVRKDGDILLCRSASYVWDKMKEIPAHALRQWAQDQERLGSLPLEDFLEMAMLPDRTLDSIPLGRAMQHCLGFSEWGIIGKGGFRPGFLMSDAFRAYVRFFAALSPPLRQAALQPEGITLTDLPQQAQEAMLKLGLVPYQNGQPVFSNGRLYCDYVPAKRWYWQPMVNYSEMQSAPVLPVISGETQEEALRLAQKVRTDVEKDHIKRGNGLFVLSIRANGNTLRYGISTVYRTQ